MLYPNGQRVLAASPRPISGALAQSGALGYGGVCGARLNRTAGFVKTASIPEGYAPAGAIVMPVRPGAMVGVARATLAGAGALLQGGPMTGAAAIALTASTATLRLNVSMTGTATISWATTPGLLALTLGMDGSGTFTLTGAAGLAMIVPFTGAGTVAGVTGGADLKGRQSMQGSWTPYTELSPENLARAVWAAVAAQYTDSTTMGGKLNTASAGGVDLSALATAVWQHAQRSLSGEQAAQLAEVWRIHGLDATAPLTVTPAARTAGDVTQAITGDGTTTTTLTREP